MKKIKRYIRHLFSTPRSVHQHFSKTAFANIENAIAKSERLHSGQIRFVVESALHPYALWQNITPKMRALELFASLGVWDTAQNNGVLIYLLLADRDVEIVGDRGIHGYVGLQGWETICHQMEQQFRKGQFESGVISGINQISVIMQQHFPSVDMDRSNELPNSPLVL